MISIQRYIFYSWLRSYIPSLILSSESRNAVKLFKNDIDLVVCLIRSSNSSSGGGGG